MNTDRFRTSVESNQLIFGLRTVIEAIQTGKELESLYIQRGLGGAIFSELNATLKEHKINFQLVPVEKLNRLTQKNHQGVVAFISPISYQKIENIIPLIYENGEIPLVLILDRITDVRNLGAIARTAACSGVHAIIVPFKGSAQINPDAIKTSAGALFKIPVCRQDSLLKTVQFLKNSGLQLIACTEKTSNYIWEPRYEIPTAIIVGSEEDGIATDLIRIADRLAKIPLLGELVSLNVSVSAGIILYEAARQRKHFK